MCRRSGNGQLEIYYGTQLLETVVDDKEHIAFRTAVGRLYSAVVYIYPAAHIPPKLRVCFEQILDELQQKPLILPDGSGRTFLLQLAPPEGFKVAMG